jgi:hypothetical protein
MARRKRLIAGFTTALAAVAVWAVSASATPAVTGATPSTEPSTTPAEQPAEVHGSPPVEYKGTIVDGADVIEQGADLQSFVKTECKLEVLAVDNRKNGMYLVQPAGVTLKFDSGSVEKILIFLEKTDSSVNVDVEAWRNADGTYELASIKNQR